MQAGDTGARSYVCGACGQSYDAPRGKCSACHAWDTVAATRGNVVAMNGWTPRRRAGAPERVRSIDITEHERGEEAERIPTGNDALDRIFGGGMVRGAIVVVSGGPAIGKSTLLLRSCADMAEEGNVVLYAITEGESYDRIVDRAERIDAVRKGLRLVRTTRLEDVRAEVLEHRPDILVVDSVSKMTTDDTKPDTMGTINRVTRELRKLVEDLDDKIAVICVVHINKDGDIAGPMNLQHMFDATLLFEETGAYRTLRSIKNRDAEEASALFEMTARGMEAVANPSARFLAYRVTGRPGSVVGTITDKDSRIARTSLVEVQALVGAPRKPMRGGGEPKRKISSTAVDPQRLAQTLELLEMALFEAGYDATAIGSRDVRVNVPGDVDAREPGMDLPIALAVASSVLARPAPATLAAFGEIGLAGEIRGVSRAPSRISESLAMGFETVLAPHDSSKGGETPEELVEVATLSDAILAAFPLPRKRPRAAAKPKKLARAPKKLKGSRR